MASPMIFRRPSIVLSPLQSTSDLEIDQLTTSLRLCTLRTGAQVYKWRRKFEMSRVRVYYGSHDYDHVTNPFKFRWIFSMWSKALLNMFQTIFIWLAFSDEHLKNLYVFPMYLYPFKFSWIFSYTVSININVMLHPSQCSTQLKRKVTRVCVVQHWKLLLSFCKMYPI